ncbi:hypothetical protein QQF64_008953 [Cirrhinus molitorella]|uniref:Uncharacterized protein n=1 Tax=Cirrhinus molitorella TaxID=172907 RepID=A0ABR3M7N5_9TELE
MGSAWSLMIPVQHLPASPSLSGWLRRIRLSTAHLHSTGSGFRFKAIMKCELIRRQKWISPLWLTEEDLKHLLKAAVSLSDVTPQLPSPLSVESFCLITDTLLGLPVTLVSSARPALKLLSVSTPSTVALSESLCHSGREFRPLYPLLLRLPLIASGKLITGLLESASWEHFKGNNP